MNDIIQNILVFLALGLALSFLIKKLIWRPKKISKTCAGNDCGCH